MADDSDGEKRVWADADFHRDIGWALSPYQLIEEQLKLYIEIAHSKIRELLLGSRVRFRYDRKDYEKHSLGRLIPIFGRYCDNDKLIKRLDAACEKRNYVAHKVIGHYMQHHDKDPATAQTVLADLEAIKEEGWTLVDQLEKEFDKLKAIEAIKKTNVTE